MFDILVFRRKYCMNVITSIDLILEIVTDLSVGKLKLL